MPISEEVKAAWIGVGGTLLGVFLGIVGTVRYQEWAHGPAEGLFTVDVSSIRLTDVDPLVREQVRALPVSVRIGHVNGPEVEDLTIRWSSEVPLSKLEVQRNDDGAKFSFSESALALAVDLPRLRKGAVIEFSFVAEGDPDLARSIQVSSGRLLEQADEPEREPWYRSDIFLLVGMSVLWVAAILAILKVASREFGRDRIFRPSSLPIVASGFLLSSFPFGNGVLLGLLLLGVVVLDRRLRVISFQVLTDEQEISPPADDSPASQDEPTEGADSLPPGE